MMAAGEAASMIIPNNPLLMQQQAPLLTNNMQQQQQQQAEAKQQQINTSKQKKKRSLPGTPDPDAEVIALSPRALLATNRFVCEICGKGFQRDQNLQLHRRGHNLPWKLRQRSGKEARKRVYVCPEPSCVHHDPSRALGDLTGIKKHFCRKHGEKKWKCDKCSKKYAVQSDWKAHSKTCGTREYRCDCGTLFSRRDSFITHRAFCDALAEETARLNAAASTTSSLLFAAPNNNNTMMTIGGGSAPLLVPPQQQQLLYPPLIFSGAGNMPHAPLGMGWLYGNDGNNKLLLSSSNAGELTPDQAGSVASSLFSSAGKQMQQHAMAKPADMSATALLHKAAQMGAVTSAAQTHLTAAYDDVLSAVRHRAAGREETRDFLGVGVQPMGSLSMPLHGWI